MVCREENKALLYESRQHLRGGSESKYRAKIIIIQWVQCLIRESRVQEGFPKH